MASDPQLVERLRKLLAGDPALVARRMFGGTCFMLNGNMCLGVHNRDLIVRVGVERAEALMARAHVKPMDITGRPMKGWARVLPAGVARDEDLLGFAAMARDFVATLPGK